MMVLPFKVVAGKKVSGLERKVYSRLVSRSSLRLNGYLINKSTLLVNSISAANFAYSQQHLQRIRPYSKGDWSTQENSYNG